jgi:hypothetical protein
MTHKSIIPVLFSLSMPHAEFLQDCVIIGEYRFIVGCAEAHIVKSKKLSGREKSGGSANAAFRSPGKLLNARQTTVSFK